MYPDYVEKLRVMPVPPPLPTPQRAAQ